MPSGSSFLNGEGPSVGQMLSGLIFLVFLLVGLALDIALVVYLLKRPPRMESWGAALRERALPGKQILLLLCLLTPCYIGCGIVYQLLFPSVSGVEPSALIFQGLTYNLPALLLIGVLFIRNRTDAPEPIGERWRRGMTRFGLSILLYLASFPILWGYSMLYQLFLSQLGYEFYLQGVAEIFLAPSPLAERVMIYVTAIVLAPVFEEFFFRGVLLPWMVKRIGFWPGIALISLLFSAIHMHLPSLLPLFLLSVFFCLAYARTRSLLVPIGMHACFNAVSTLLITLTGGM